MARTVGLCAACALLTLGIAGSPPANAQSPTDTDVTITWSEAHQARTMDAGTRVGLSADEIAAIKPLLDELEDSERTRRDEIARIKHDLLFVDSPELDVNARTEQINAEHRARVDRIWASISERVGGTKAMLLREYIYALPVTQTTLYQSEHMAKIDQALVDWDKATAERIAMEERNRLIREEIAATERAQKEAVAAAPVAPVVTVSPVEERPVAVATPAEAPRAEVAAPPATATPETQIDSAVPARLQEGTQERQPVNRRKRIRGLG